MIPALLAAVALSGFGAAAAWAPGAWSRDRPDIDPTTPVRALVLAYLALYAAGSVAILVAGESSGAGAILAGLALAAFGGGALASRAIWGRPGPLPLPTREGLSPVVVAALAAVGLAALGVLIVGNGLPLLAADPQASRAGFGGLLFDLFRWLTPPAALTAVAVAVVTGRRRDQRVAAAALVAVGGLELLLASRALPFELAVEALLVAYWAGIRPSVRASAALGLAGVVVFVGVLFVRVAPEGGFSGAADAAAFAVRRTVDRVLLIHPRTLEVTATLIPAEEPYFGGSTYVRRISTFLGQEDRPALGYWLYERLFPGQPGGFAAPGVAGEAWANAGPLLVVGIMAALGAFAALLARVLGRLPGGPADRAFAAIVVVAVARTYATSLNGFLLTVLVAGAWWFAASGRLGRLVQRPSPTPPSAL